MLEARNGLLPPAEVRQGSTELGVGVGKIRQACQCAPMGCNGLLRLPECTQHDAEIVMRERELRFEFACLTEAGRGGFELADVLEHSPQVVMCLGVSLVESDGAAMLLGGLVEPSVRAQGGTEVGLRFRVRWQKPRGGLQRLERILVLRTLCCTE